MAETHANAIIKQYEDDLKSGLSPLFGTELSDPSSFAGLTGKLVLKHLAGEIAANSAEAQV